MARLMRMVPGILGLLAACSALAAEGPRGNTAAPSTLAQPGAPALHQDWRIGASGYGPVRPGMTLAQAEALMGSRLRTDSGGEIDPWCDHVYAEKGHAGVAFMVEEGLVTHAMATTKEVAADSGIRVGDPASAVVRHYGPRLEIESHKYTDGFYYFAWTRAQESGIKYEISAGGVVESIHGGGPTIMRVEGCA